MQGFRCIFYMPDEAAQIISHCEECQIKAKIITGPFSATEIQGGILKEYLIDEDYLAPQKVNFTNHLHFFMLFLVNEVLGVTTTQVICYILLFPIPSVRRATGIWHFKKPSNNRHIQRLKRKKVKPTPIYDN